MRQSRPVEEVSDDEQPAKVVTPKMLADTFETMGVTSEHAERMNQIWRGWIGKRVEVSGFLDDVLDPPKASYVWAKLHDKSGYNAYVGMTFSKTWGGRLKAVGEDRRVTVRGRVKEFSKGVFTLENCELVEADSGEIIILPDERLEKLFGINSKGVFQEWVNRQIEITGVVNTVVRTGDRVLASFDMKGRSYGPTITMAFSAAWERRVMDAKGKRVGVRGRVRDCSPGSLNLYDCVLLEI